MPSVFGPGRGGAGAAVYLLLLTFVALLSPSFAQTTSLGNIQGSITDTKGAAISGADITITNTATGGVVNTSTSSAGLYSSGGLLPGEYSVRIQAKGFKPEQLLVTVHVSEAASGNVDLAAAPEGSTPEIQVFAPATNTEQATVQGIITGKQMEILPVNGRNFLGLAQLEPGVQLLDGTSIAATKAGYPAISINSISPRSPRFELDGLDISDETVGATTQNLAMGSIQEFNISRSSLDLPAELTASGTVNLATRSGTNGYHGEAFYNFRDQQVGFAKFPGGQALPFQRNQFGGRFGGALIHDRLFFFAAAERTKQEGFGAVPLGPPFTALSGGYRSPLRGTQSSGRVDWQARQDIHVFYRVAYDVNSLNSDAFAGGYSVYSNRDNAPSHAGGVSWNQGTWSHSFRFGYLKFHNTLGDATQSFPLAQNPLPGALISFGDTNFSAGPSFVGPQQTYQSNKQAKYDGSKVRGSHIFRFGGSVNRILVGEFASPYGFGPNITSFVNSRAAYGTAIGVGIFCTNPNFANCDPNPLDYPITGAVLSNGQRYFTEKSAFGSPAGGQADTRVEAYVGDSWKMKPNLTLTYGVRYVRDSGRTDSDLVPIPCSATTLISCNGNLLDQFGFSPGLSNRVRQPNGNFGPQFGFAWDPSHRGRTVFRGGVGTYYENSIFNNAFLNRPGKLASGSFWSAAHLTCSPGAFQSGRTGQVGIPFPGQTGLVTSIDGLDLGTQVCFNPIATAGQAVADLQAAYAGARNAAGPASNSGFVGNTLSLGPGNGYAAFAPNYRTPRSYQMNLGMQREIGKSGMFTIDYVRNVSVHFLLTSDANHVGDSRYLNVGAAQNAISIVNQSFGCGAGFDEASIDCAIAAGATIDSYAGLQTDPATGVPISGGLGSGQASLSGYGPAAFGLPAQMSAAFGGVNNLMGAGYFQYPAGRSLYSAVQAGYRQQVSNPLRGVTSMTLQIAYTLSRFQSNGGNDQNASAVAYDFRHPTSFFGQTSLDRTHQINFGATFEIRQRGPQLSLLGSFLSPAASNLSLYSAGQFSPAEIFRTDLTGDGTVGDLINSASGTGKPGTYMRSVRPGTLSNAISTFNTSVAGALTPAGQALVSANLFRRDQLVSLGAVVPTIAPPTAFPAGNKFYKNVDAALNWPIRIGERFTIQPSVSVYNVFNFANFTSVNGVLARGSGFANGTSNGNNASHNVLRYGVGSGALIGAARQTEFGIKFVF
jgi:hypothetical protein